MSKQARLHIVVYTVLLALGLAEAYIIWAIGHIL